MSKAPAYPMYAQDFDMDTASWTVAEIGAYVRLLNYEWVNGALPTGISHLARIARVDLRTMHKMYSAVIAKKFFTNDANMLVNRRMEEERDKLDKYHEIQREKGKQGADKRWHKNIAGAMPELSPEDKPQDSFSFSSSNKKEIIKKEKPRQQKLTDEEYFSALKINPAYQGIDIDLQIGKCQAWCLSHDQAFTRRRFINWLNRVERPIGVIPIKKPRSVFPRKQTRN